MRRCRPASLAVNSSVQHFQLVSALGFPIAEGDVPLRYLALFARTPVPVYTWSDGKRYNTDTHLKI